MPGTAMRFRRLTCGCGVGLALLVAATQAFAQAAQTPTKPYEPQVGQPGKDVVWVPTSQVLVDKMLDMAQLTAADSLIDLGSGDGVTVITAAKRGARALGIEYNPDMVALSTKRAADAGVSDRASFVKADLFESDFSHATVITMFLLPSINMKLRPKLLDLRPGTRIVSNSFSMEDWEADQMAQVSDCVNWCTALLWIVPAKVAGSWQLGQDELRIAQQFQHVTGTLGSTAFSGGTLKGDEIAFTVDGARYAGRVEGDTMRGTVTTNGSGRAWTATRRW